MTGFLTTYPLASVALTLMAFAGAQWINVRSNAHPLANPVLLSAAAIIALLSITRTPYEE
jgi:putative effector of murein hydrolase